MSKIVTQEIAIVIAVKIQNPTMLNEDFLKQTGIIPIDWQLEREPVYSDRVAQIMFANGFSIVAQPDRLIFLEMVGNKSIDALTAGEVAQKYVATLKMAEYQTVGINFRSYAPQNSPDAATEYINHKLLNAGTWQHGIGKMRASVNLNYDLGARQLNLSIDSAKIQFPTPLIHPAVVFSGTFSYEHTADVSGRVAQIATIISNWKQELNKFNGLIAERFLAATVDSQDTKQPVVNDLKIVDAPALPPMLLTSN
jgi:hypothetical protein